MAARILVVDDDEAMRELLRIHLAAAGYDVETAADAIGAAYRVLASAPDLLIVDVRMPYMDGFEFVAALAAERIVPRIPVIFLSSLEEGMERGRELGAVDYLVKPVRADALLRTVARHLRPA